MTCTNEPFQADGAYVKRRPGYTTSVDRSKGFIPAGQHKTNIHARRALGVISKRTPRGASQGASFTRPSLECDHGTVYPYRKSMTDFATCRSATTGVERNQRLNTVNKLYGHLKDTLGPVKPIRYEVMRPKRCAWRYNKRLLEADRS